ncbi:hypothetical protein V7147_00785, partial [Bacillus sp. JJ1521]|uniref:hypothetical protein n=1 Tax=Bacillus sp. JJ1521 TaxID=3122957 RepID=UPI002FFDB1D3
SFQRTFKVIVVAFLKQLLNNIIYLFDSQQLFYLFFISPPHLSGRYLIYHLETYMARFFYKKIILEKFFIKK